MSDSPPTARQMCVYCSVRPAVQREHVVAKVFFTTPLPEMITVPSCGECSSGRGDGGPREIHLDEEYVRNILCLKVDLDAHPIASRLLKEKVVKSFERSRGLAETVLGTTRWVEVRTPQGIIFPDRQAAFIVEVERVRRVVRKIVRGLYFAKEGIPMPADLEIGVIPDLDDNLFDSCLGLFQEPKWYGLGDRVFNYVAARKAPGSFETIWLMVFYGQHAAFASTWQIGGDGA